MRIRRLIAVAAVGAVGATGISFLGAGPAGAGGGGGTSWPVDAQIKVKGDPVYSGIEIFGPPTPGQFRGAFALPGETALFRVRIQNTKFQNNRIVVFEDGFAGFIRVIDGKVDVTDEVFDGTYVKKVGPRESFVLKVKVRPGDSGGVLLGAYSRKFPGGTDYVLAEAGTEFEV